MEMQTCRAPHCSEGSWLRGTKAEAAAMQLRAAVARSIVLRCEILIREALLYMYVSFIESRFETTPIIHTRKDLHVVLLCFLDCMISICHDFFAVNVIKLNLYINLS